MDSRSLLDDFFLQIKLNQLEEATTDAKVNEFS